MLGDFCTTNLSWVDKFLVTVVNSVSNRCCFIVLSLSREQLLFWVLANLDLGWVKPIPLNSGNFQILKITLLQVLKLKTESNEAYRLCRSANFRVLKNRVWQTGCKHNWVLICKTALCPDLCVIWRMKLFWRGGGRVKKSVEGVTDALWMAYTEMRFNG